MKILLIAVSAKNIHKPLAPWSIKAYCDFYNPGCGITVLEFNINENVGDIIRGIFKEKPDMVAFSSYLWNIEIVIKLMKTIKKLLPSCIAVLGGPEVSFEKSLDSFPYADYIIQGAGEAAFSKLLNVVLAGNLPKNHIIESVNRSFVNFPSPFTADYFASFQTDRMSSIKNQLIYYESSRGCPFNCAYCLSCATRGVQFLPISRVKAEINLLVSHGAKCVKFVDGTFNADKKRAAVILEYIMSLQTDCTFHFEAAADLFDKALLNTIASMPVNRIQFELGIQSVNPQTLNAVARQMDITRALSNIKRLTVMKNCHIHVDLIAGLPFETVETFANAINQCLAVHPHMLQLGFLKMLKGSAIREKSDDFDYIYYDFAPYEVLQSGSMSTEDMMTLKRIERVIEKFYNSGMFKNSLRYAAQKLFKNEFELFRLLGDYCGDISNIKVSLKNSYAILFDFLLKHGAKDEVEHYIKLDCFTFDSKGLLPDGIAGHRDKDTEARLKSRPDYKDINIKVEYFRFDSKKRLFLYDVKDPISKAFRVMEL